MATTTSLTLSDLIEEALSLLYRPLERPLQVAVGSDALSTTADTSLNLSADETAVQVGTVLENGRELMLVTARSADANPTFTVSRGYQNTPKQTAATGATLLVSPLWPRQDVYRAILRCFQGSFATHLPAVSSTTKTVTANVHYVSMPADCIDVLRVGFNELEGSNVDRWQEITQVEFIEDVPTTVVSTGKLITLPRWLQANQELHITYQSTYAWSGGTSTPAETETISVPATAADLPSLYAAAFLVMNREITRLELDRVEEWNQETAIRQGVNVRLALQLWNEYYRRLDECRRVQNVPRHRPYRKLATQMGGRWENGSRSVRRL